MNLKHLNNLLRPKSIPAQQKSEWRMFLEICETYLNKHNITHPIVVELGVGRNRQKRMWETIFGAEHIGMDKSNRRGEPDILGDIHDPMIFEMLTSKLRGRPINILFIDADHSYEAVKQDFEIYAPLCSDIIVLHDIETARYKLHSRREVWKFWDELRKKTYEGKEEYRNLLFISIYQYKAQGQLGIGMIIKQ